MTSCLPARRTGFSLVELLVVIAIVAVLAGLALPGYGTYVARAERVRAQAQLLEAAQWMERFHAAQATYAQAQLPARFQVSPPGAAPASARYRIALESDDMGYTLTAVLQAESDGCGDLRLRHTGAREVSEAAARVEDCWR